MIKYVLVMFEFWASYPGLTGREILTKVLQQRSMYPHYELTEAIKVHNPEVLDIAVDDMPHEFSLYVTFGIKMDYEDGRNAFLDDCRQIVRVKEAGDVDSLNVTLEEYNRMWEGDWSF